MEKEGFTLAVGPGKPVKTKFKEIDITKLHFFPDNPRVSSTVMHLSKKELTDEKIYELMGAKKREACHTLYQIVKKDGQINEPLIVYKNQTLEGNTRLWVVKTLYNDIKDLGEKQKWRRVPCRVIEGKLSSKEIDYILCNVHIKKKRDWIPFETACYLYRMNAEDGRPIKEISADTGINPVKVMDYIKTYKEMKRLKAGPEAWSTIYETVKEPEVKKIERRRGISMVDVIFREYKKGNLENARDPRKLQNILKDEIATKKFINGEVDISQAENIAKARIPGLADPFLKELNNVKTMIENLSRGRIIRLNKDPRKLKIVQDFIQAIKEFSKYIKK